MLIIKYYLYVNKEKDFFNVSHFGDNRYRKKLSEQIANV